VSTDIEQRLKSQMDQVQVRLRPELAREAHRSFRRHRVVRRSAAVAGTAVIVAAATVAATVGAVPFSSGHGIKRPTPVQHPKESRTPPASELPPLAGDSLTPAQAARDIFWMRHVITAHDPANTVVDSQWNYGGQARELTYYPDGRPWDDSEVTTFTKPRPGSTDVVVNYDNHTWSRSTDYTSRSGGTASTPPAAQVCQMGPIAANLTDPAAIRAELNCPGYVVTHNQRVNGIDAIEIQRNPGKDGAVALWVNAKTYLPLKATVYHSPNDEPPAAYNNAKSPLELWQYGFLPPTKDNLAILNIPIPPGFKGSSTVSQAAPLPAVWTPPATGAIPPFGLQPVPPGNALTVRQAASDILYTRTAYPGPSGKNAVVDLEFGYHSASRSFMYASSGAPQSDRQVATIRGADGKPTTIITEVHYAQRFWIRGPAVFPGGSQVPQGCSAGLSSIPFQGRPDLARLMMNCPEVKVTRSQKIAGIDAVKLTQTFTDPKATVTLWVSAATYLPIELVGGPVLPQPPTTTWFTYLPPTPANLAYLGIVIPPGFKHNS
jgi:hypothetical protein